MIARTMGSKNSFAQVKAQRIRTRYANPVSFPYSNGFLESEISDIPLLREVSDPSRLRAMQFAADRNTGLLQSPNPQSCSLSVLPNGQCGRRQRVFVAALLSPATMPRWWPDPKSWGRCAKGILCGFRLSNPT